MSFKEKDGYKRRAYIEHDDVWDSLKVIAKKEGISIQKLLRTIVRESVKNYSDFNTENKLVNKLSPK